MKLSEFEVLSFDCYGTLIDWESGIYAALAPLLSRADPLTSRADGASTQAEAGPAPGEPSAERPLGHPEGGRSTAQPEGGRSTAQPEGGRSPAGMGLSRSGVEMSREAVLQAFARLESRQQEKTPGMTYPELLAEVHAQLAIEFDVAPDPAEAAAFGASIGQWPAFPDTLEALRFLKRHARLVILSNVDRASFQATKARLGVEFDAVYTAQDIGSYKPDRRNFVYLLDRMREQGVPKEKLLHVAQSLFHDHVPANAVGLTSVWIDRRHDAEGGGATAPAAGNVHYDFRFTSLDALVRAYSAG